ncbi:importin-alpha export receptor [Paramarasmius palmivorus]|uniref:Importin-alpha export receptor n=1 Tax=Paramarasmius palmivorus TaxID=297713 RepID=A0AAW0B806_9AGAR
MCMKILQAQANAHPILQGDAIRFLYTFRNQLTKQQLPLSVLPLERGEAPGQSQRPQLVRLLTDIRL